MAQSLEELLRRQIRRDGAIPLDHFLAFSTSHYYATAEPFPAIGAETEAKTKAGVGTRQRGDFTTAPETSQVFGELLGLWLADQWRKANTPTPISTPCLLAEAGGGTGRLFADLWSALARADATFCAAVKPHLIETSRALRKAQEARLAKLSPPVEATWHESLGTLPRGALFFVANEFLDALPIRQYVFTQGKWHERGVTLDQDGLAFCLVSARPPVPVLTPNTKRSDTPFVVELSPQREAVIDLIARQIATQGGAALLIDYGYEEASGQSTLSAIRQHKPAEVLRHLGQTDLSSHVDFAACQRVAEQAGVKAQLTTQGEFLRTHGLEQRATALPEPAARAARSLIEQGGLGDFRVLALTRD